MRTLLPGKIHEGDFLNRRGNWRSQSGQPGITFEEECIFGYLVCLNVPEVLHRLTDREIYIASKCLMGGLAGLTDILENCTDYRSSQLLALVREREFRNATENRPVDDPVLKEVTRRLAWELLRYLSEDGNPL